MSAKPTVLLVHGSWHGPWCWDRLIPELEARGLSARTVALPSCGNDHEALGTLADDSAAVAKAAAEIDGGVIVLGHSYGGVVLGNTDFPGNVRQLIYLGAFMPDQGQSLVATLPPGPLPPYVAIGDDGISRIVHEQIGPMLYGDCDAETVSWADARVVDQNAAVVTTPLERASWRSIPTIYIVLTNDLAIPTPAQRNFAKQAGQVIEFESSHSPFASRPRQLAEVVAGIVGMSRSAADRRKAPTGR